VILLAMLLAAPDCGAAVTQADLNFCTAIGYGHADTALNAVWPRALAMARRMGGGDQLLAAQRAWLTFRDAECEAENAGSTGGSMHGMSVGQCRIAATNDRIRQLYAITKEH
jgi:uncharacterized protein YecT (DUF1311 family)